MAAAAKRAIRSLGRISAGALLGLGLLWLALFSLLRQPTWGGADIEGLPRAEPTRLRQDVELARLLEEYSRRHRLNAPVLLVAYGTEEPPGFASAAMGSRVHASSLSAQDVELWGMICLEMIGYFSDKQPWPNWLYKSLYPSHGHFVGIVGRLADRRLARQLKSAFRGHSTLPAYSFTAPAWLPGLDASDHRSYWAHGYSAVMVTDTSFIRNPHYHTAADRPETLDYEKMAAVVDGVLAAVVMAVRELEE